MAAIFILSFVLIIISVAYVRAEMVINELYNDNKALTLRLASLINSRSNTTNPNNE
jgi:hypothetical protein